MALREIFTRAVEVVVVSGSPVLLDEPALPGETERSSCSFITSLHLSRQVNSVYVVRDQNEDFLAVPNVNYIHPGGVVR